MPLSRRLKKTLDRVYVEYDFAGRLQHDPLAIPRRYADPEDIEVAGFVSACFAYGRIDLFRQTITKILSPAGEHPFLFFKNFLLRKDRKYFQGISYRFNSEQDVLCFIYLLSRVLKERDSLRELFYSSYTDSDPDLEKALSGFTDYFLGLDTAPVYGKNLRPAGLRQLLPSPRNGSACKRLNLFIRWMVRDRDVDLGIWNRIPRSKLIIPLDTHIARIARCLGMTGRKASDWKTAKEITESLKKIDPDDPLKYDFVLCHYGISGMCRGKRFRKLCSACAFYAI